MGTSLQPIISVVVCTFNRARDVLEDVLETLSQQDIDSSLYEIIVVDNNSSDETAVVSRGFCRKYSNFYYFLEKQQGLSHARNTGWRVAKGQYVIYVDDDCKIPKQYLGVAQSIINEFRPVAFGGPALPFYKIEKPNWYKDQYGTFKAFEKSCVLIGGDCRKIYGMNMGFRRDALVLSGGFDPKLGMTGYKIAYSEESALLTHLNNLLPDDIFYYSIDFYVYHLVPQRKMSLSWFVKSTFSLGCYSMESFGIWVLPPEANRLTAARIFLKKGMKIVLDVIIGAFFRNRSKYPYFKNYIFENSFNKILLFGRLYAKIFR